MPARLVRRRSRLSFTLIYENCSFVFGLVWVVVTHILPFLAQNLFHRHVSQAFTWVRICGWSF